MFQPSRLLGVLMVVAGGLAIFVGMHFVLGYALGPNAVAIHPRQRIMGGPLYERVWRRISALDRLYEHGQLPPDAKLGMYLGVSTTATGIQRRILDDRATVANRWIVLSGAGVSIENLETVMLPIFFCRVKPSVVVLGLHQTMIVGEKFMEDQTVLGQPREVGRRRRAWKWHWPQLTPLKHLPRHWIVRNHAIVEQFLRSQMYAWRLSVFYTAEVSAGYLFEPAIEPWDDDPLWLWNMYDAEGEFANEQMAYWQRQGHFKAANYDPAGEQAQSLVRMIRAYRELGAEVYVVVMPLRSSMRSMVPPNAKPCLQEALDRAFPESPPELIDLEDALPDRLFTDNAHLSKAGGEQLSRIVAKRLQAPAKDPGRAQ